MAIDPISWMIIAGSFIAGAATGAIIAYFWDDIKAWASRVLGYILDAINYAIEVTSNAITYLVREGYRIYKRIEVHVHNIRTGRTRLECIQQEISPADIPDEILEQLGQKLKLMESST